MPDPVRRLRHGRILGRHPVGEVAHHPPGGPVEPAAGLSSSPGSSPGVPPSTAALFEDALAGVEAGRAGGLGCVVGVDRAGQAAALREHGADLVVADLADLLPS